MIIDSTKLAVECQIERREHEDVFACIKECLASDNFPTRKIFEDKGLDYDKHVHKLASIRKIPDNDSEALDSYVLANDIDIISITYIEGTNTTQYILHLSDEDQIVAIENNIAERVD